MRYTQLLFVVSLLVVTLEAAAGGDQSNPANQRQLPPVRRIKKTQAFSCKFHYILFLIAAIMHVLNMYFNMYLPRQPLAPATVGLTHYKPVSVVSYFTGVSPSGLYLELRARHVESPPEISFDTFKAQYPLHKMLKDYEGRQVWLSHDQETKRKMVVKKILPEEVHKEAENELKAMRLIAMNPHAGLKPARKVIYDGKGPAFIVSDYVEGVPLGYLGGLTAEEAAWLLWDAAHALQHLHEKVNLAHTDLHNGNLMVDHKGNVKIIDFTHARPLTRKDYDEDVALDLNSSGAFIARGFFSAHRGRITENDELVKSILLQVKGKKIVTPAALIKILRETFPQILNYKWHMEMKVRDTMKARDHLNKN